MAEQNIFCVGGYRFGSEEDAKLAEVELKKSVYFEEKLNGRSTQNILAVYDKIIDEKVFSTPVGWEYLRNLQEKLRMAGVPDENILPVPMYVVFAHKEEPEHSVLNKIRPTKKVSKDRKNLRISLILNVFLAVLVLAMFVITMTGDNPNILNYKNAITNQYASWEQELTEREQALREKEAEFIDSDIKSDAGNSAE